MKLLFDLPKTEMEVFNETLGHEKILYCTPYDLSISGKLVDGWFVVTKDHYITIENGLLIEKVNITSKTNYKLINAVGSGMIEAEADGRDKIVVRFSMTHVPRYSYMVEILKKLSKGELPKVISDDNENKCPKCGRSYPRASKVCNHCMNKKAVVKRFLAMVKPYIKPLILAISLFWVLTGISLINPLLYRRLIDNYLSRQKSDTLGILTIILGIGLCDFSRTIIEIIKNRIMLKVGNAISRDLRKTIFEKIQSLSIGYLDTKKTGDLMNRITGDTDNIKRFITDHVSFGINEILSLTVVTVVLFIMNFKLTLMLLVPIPFIAYIWKWIRKRFNTMYHTQWKSADKCNSILHDILSGIKVVKAFGMEEKEVNRFSKESKQLAFITARNEKIGNTIFPILNFVMGIGNFLILYYGGRLILGKQMQLGELIQFTQYAAMLYGPLGWLTFFPRALTEAAASTERIFEILDEEPEIRNLPEAETHDIIGNVIFNNITFGYKSYEPVVKNIEMNVKSGEMIGLVGHSGSGKSTLINLIMRLYDVDEGQILIDGKDIKNISLEALRSQIGVVLQETFLFSGTILQNITYAKPEASLPEVIRAAKIANAHDFIMKFPDAYDTKVGEKGHRLSGGERQRIAIARAILHDPKILILDEATASVDTETEYQIQEALGRLIKDRTTFAIAHRLSTLRNASRLMVIDKGRQIEVGSHEELMKTRGKYYSLVMAQREMSRTKGG
jgi:ATP-binding cassette subfamily B protein